MEDDMCPCGFPANDPTSTHGAWHRYWEYKQAFNRSARKEREAKLEQLIQSEPEPPATQQSLL